MRIWLGLRVILLMIAALPPRAMAADTVLYVAPPVLADVRPGDSLPPRELTPLELMQRAFDQARAAKRWTAADSLAAKLLVDKRQVEDIIGYYIYDRGRCSEALALLESTRRTVKPDIRNGRDALLRSALVCEAARLALADPVAADALLGEAIDEGSYNYNHTPDLYRDFASQDALNLPAMRYLIARQLDGDENGYAMERQISRGNIDNVRTLLELGADPNERHGIQHAAFGEIADQLPQQGEKMLEMARLLIEYGADPTMWLDFSGAEREIPMPRAPVSPLKPQMIELFREAGRKLAAVNPLDVDFYDYEPNTPPSRWPSFARFYVYNRSDKPVVLDMYRDGEGFDYAGSKTLIEYSLPPSTVWRKSEWVIDQWAPLPGWKRPVVAGNDFILLRVPVNLYMLLDGPPSMRLRVRIPSTDGIDYVSEPFSLHDSRYVRGYWPRKGQPIERLSLPGEKLVLAKGEALSPVEAGSNAPHSHSNEPDPVPNAPAVKGKRSK